MLLGLRQQDVTAANISNASTVGYKADQSAQMSFGGVLATRTAPSGEPVATPGGQKTLIGRVGEGTYIATVRTDISQGPERETGEALDVMLRGQGFFLVQTPQGIRYTRDGHFDRDDDNRLVTADRSPVLDTEGQPIVIDTERVRIKADGAIYRLVPEEVTNADGTRSQRLREDLIARLGVVDLDAADLTRAGSSRFSVADGAKVTPVDFTTGGTSILQGVLEEANVNVGQTATRMFSLSRTFEASQRVFSTLNETLERAVRDVGRV
jgi:flagellar basal-body rod protein FlgG